MQTCKVFAAAVAAASIGACGGSRDAETTIVASAAPTVSTSASTTVSPKAPAFSSLVSFGDSLSDVGTYAVGAIRAAGGGKFTINAPDSKIWIEQIALQLGLVAPCAAQTGLNGDPAQGYFVPVTNFPECTAYAQGGARVAEPVRSDGDAVVGALALPVATQIQNHLTLHGGRFGGNEIVLVMAGGNDLIAQLARVGQGGNPFDAVEDLGRTGTELGQLVKAIVAVGASHVVVVNVPDASTSPSGRELPGIVERAAQEMAKLFNANLQQEVQGVPEILYVDAYTKSQEYSANPAQFGLTDVTTPACDLSPEKNALGSAILCTPANLIPGPVDRFEFADHLHPTPYGHQLLAAFVASEMQKRGWLQ
jgi:outer membrane lipase/esterase